MATIRAGKRRTNFAALETPEPALTGVNAITGTPLYMAPEAIVAPDTIDARADLYALGAVGYWLLTGTHVFSGSTIVEVCRVVDGTPPPAAFGRRETKRSQHAC